MNKGFVMTLVGAVIGCVGVGYILGFRAETINEELIDEVSEDLVEESTNVIKKVIREVKEYMNNKVTVVTETIQFCKDILSSGSYRATLGVVIICAGVGIGGGLVASAYIPMPNPA